MSEDVDFGIGQKQIFRLFALFSKKFFWWIEQSLARC